MTAKSVQLYQALIALYPTAFRRKYGAEMTLLFRDCLRDASHDGTTGIATVWLATVVDLAMSAPSAHIEEWTNMQASYTQSSQVGALVAIISAVLLTGTITGVMGIDTPNDTLSALLTALLGAAWFGMIFALYRRLQAVRDAVSNKAGLATGFLAMLLMLAAAVLNYVGNATSGPFAGISLLLGLAALALLGISAVRFPELGLFRFAPLLATLSVVALVTLFVWWNEVSMWVGLGSAILSLVGTGVLLWTKSK